MHVLFLDVRGEGGGSEIFLWVDLIYFIRRIHQPVEGESWSSGGAVAPVT